MKSNYDNKIRLERLSFNHLSILNITQQQHYDNSLNLYLLRALILNPLAPFPIFNKYIKVKAYIAFEYEKPIAILLLNSFNLKLTTWFLKEPLVFNEPSRNTLSHILISLINRSIVELPKQTLNLLIKCNSLDTQLISITRELGFQPLNRYIRWSFEKASLPELILEKARIYLKEYEWKKISKDNIYDVVRLDQSHDSTHLRQIKDLTSNDYLFSSDRSNILYSKIHNHNIPLASIISVQSSNQKQLLRLLINRSYQLDLIKIFTILTYQAYQFNNTIDIETIESDKSLNLFLQDSGFKPISNVLLLGKTSWKRVDNQHLIKTDNRLESVFEKLSPQSSPLPSPIKYI